MIELKTENGTTKMNVIGPRFDVMADAACVALNAVRVFKDLGGSPVSLMQTILQELSKEGDEP